MIERATIAIERIAAALETLVERPKDDGPNVIERIANALEVLDEESLCRIAEAAEDLSECILDYGERGEKAFRTLPVSD
jgi:hypothetical protein